LRWKNSIPASWEIFSVSVRPIFVKSTEGTASGHPARAMALLIGTPVNPWLPDLFKEQRERRVMRRYCWANYN
jgi:hypothetical protein